MYKYRFTRRDYEVFAYALGVLKECASPCTGHAYTGIGKKNEMPVSMKIDINKVPIGIRAMLSILVRCEMLAVSIPVTHYQPSGKKISYPNYYLLDGLDIERDCGYIIKAR